MPLRLPVVLLENAMPGCTGVVPPNPDPSLPPAPLCTRRPGTQPPKRSAPWWRRWRVLSSRQAPAAQVRCAVPMRGAVGSRGRLRGRPGGTALLPHPPALATLLPHTSRCGCHLGSPRCEGGGGGADQRHRPGARQVLLPLLCAALPLSASRCCVCTLSCPSRAAVRAPHIHAPQQRAGSCGRRGEWRRLSSAGGGAAAGQPAGR